MATLHIIELSSLARTADGDVIPVPDLESIVTTQVVTFTTTAQTAAFNAKTKFVRVSPSADAVLDYGTNPDADLNTFLRMAANSAEFFGVLPGKKLAAAEG